MGRRERGDGEKRMGRRGDGEETGSLLDSEKFSRRVSGEKKIGHPIQKSAVMSETGWYKKIDSQCYLSIMQLCQRLEQILENLRSAFSREATYQWFILLAWGVVLNSQPSAITSYVNALGLTESYYHQALHWFESKAFNVKGLTLGWSKWVSQHENLYRIKEKRVYVGDGIKVGKEGRKMPGVKRLVVFWICGSTSK